MELEHFGTFLRRGREARGLTIGDLSRATKIKERSLELLEEAELASLPAAVFVRGFVCAYARAVGVDEKVALSKLRESMPPTKAEVEFAPIPPPETESENAANEDGRRRFGVALVVLLILVVATLTLSLLLRHSTRPGGGLSELERAPSSPRYL